MHTKKPGADDHAFLMQGTTLLVKLRYMYTCFCLSTILLFTVHISGIQADKYSICGKKNLVYLDQFCTPPAGVSHPARCSGLLPMLFL